MRASTSISSVCFAVVSSIALISLASPGRGSLAYAADATAQPAPHDKKDPSNDKSLQPEEDDFSSSPFTDYGEFNQEEEEAADTRFFQNGRFFGVGIGAGMEGITGNRGLLWQGGSPALDFRVHYWFDFNVALDLAVSTASHFYDSAAAGGHVDVSMLFVGAHIRYYFDTKNLSAALTFANPYVLIGGGGFNKSETTNDTTDKDSAFGFSAGGGLEFPIKARKFYFTLEGRYSLVTFKDTYLSKFSKTNGIPDLTGGFYNLTAGVMFTW